MVRLPGPSLRPWPKARASHRRSCGHERRQAPAWMKFRAGDLEFNANVAESSEAPSPQTGDLLRALTIQFRAQKISMHQQALEQAQQRAAGGLFSLTDANEPEL